ncbi:MAG: cold shock domain-containing protein [Methanomassiliicoccales archaeon]
MKWLGSYGFVESPDFAEQVFVHISEIEGRDMLQEGEEIEFDVMNTYKGPRAVNVQLDS